MEGENTQINFWLRSCKQNRERNIQKKLIDLLISNPLQKDPGDHLTVGNTQKYMKYHNTEKYGEKKTKKKNTNKERH